MGNAPLPHGSDCSAPGSSVQTDLASSRIRVPSLTAKIKTWLGVEPVLMEVHEPDDLHHYLLHYLLIYQAGRFLSFSSLRQVAKPASMRDVYAVSGARPDDDD